jgi:hypothetical protein
MGTAAEGRASGSREDDGHDVSGTRFAEGFGCAGGAFEGFGRT